MNSFDVSELREHNENFNEKIQAMERLQRATEGVMEAQENHIKVQDRIISTSKIS